MDLKHVGLSYGAVLYFPSRCSPNRISNLRGGASKLQLSNTLPIVIYMRWHTKEQA